MADLTQFRRLALPSPWDQAIFLECSCSIKSMQCFPLLRRLLTSASNRISVNALEQLLAEVVAASTITNYAGKITNPPLEAFLQEHAWRG